MTVVKRMKGAGNREAIEARNWGQDKDPHNHNWTEIETECVFACGTEVFPLPEEELDMDLSRNWVALVPISRIPNHCE